MKNSSKANTNALGMPSSFYVPYELTAKMKLLAEDRAAQESKMLGRKIEPQSDSDFIRSLLASLPDPPNFQKRLPGKLKEMASDRERRGRARRK